MPSISAEAGIRCLLKPTDGCPWASYNCTLFAILLLLTTNNGLRTMIRIGIVGIGFMGMIHYLAAQKLKDARVAAICSRDPKKLAGDWRGIRGNFGPPGQQMDLGDIGKYAQLDAMLKDPAIDLVDICNPTDLHPKTAIAALEA